MTPRRTTAAPVHGLAAAIDEIELGLRRDDPRFVRRMERLDRAVRFNAVAVVTLLVISAVLLTLGLATQSAWPWAGGAGALVAAFAVDGLHRWRLEREPTRRSAP